MAGVKSLDQVKSLEHLLQILGRDESIRRALKATEKLRSFIKVDKEQELSEKAQKLKELCISLGRPGNVYARMFSILLDENIIVKTNNDMFPFVKWACIIPKDQNGHKYRPGELLFMIKSNNDQMDCESVKAIKEDGTMGDNISPYMKSVKIPDNEEVIKRINAIFDNLLAKGISDQGFREGVMNSSVKF